MGQIVLLRNAIFVYPNPVLQTFTHFFLKGISRHSSNKLKNVLLNIFLIKRQQNHCCKENNNKCINNKFVYKHKYVINKLVPLNDGYRSR